MGLFGPSKKDLARLTRQKAPEIERAAHDAEEEARDLDRIARDFQKSGDPELAESYRKDAAEARWAAKRLSARAADARRGITSW